MSTTKNTHKPYEVMKPALQIKRHPITALQLGTLFLTLGFGLNSQAETITYIHTDGLGSPVAKSDAAGNLLANSRTRYEPYGREVAGTATPTIGFTGHVNDADTGLTYMQQRYYDPVAGRFLSTDPVLTDANTAASFNRYTYALNNPFKFIDPDGRASCFNKDCSLSKIDSEIKRADGKIAKVTFENDDRKGSNPNQPISTKTAILIETIISKANVESVNINSTTGGVHEEGSNHYKGRAVDINRVNGEKVSMSNQDAKNLQTVARSESATRENFGPSIMEKNAVAGGKTTTITDKAMTQAHKNHLHISGQE